MIQQSGDIRNILSFRANYAERVGFGVVKIPGLMKARLQLLLASCLGLVVGFTLCHIWFVESPDDPMGASTSLSTSTVAGSFPEVLAGYQEASNSTWLPSQLMKDRQFVSPGWTIPEDWKITIWHPTYPPQKAGTFDVAEYVGRTMRLTNR